MAPPSELTIVLEKLAELGKKQDDTNSKIAEMQNDIRLLTEEQSSVRGWKPELEGKVLDLQNTVFDLKQKVDLFIHELPKVKQEASASAHLEATASDAEMSGQFGHRQDVPHRSAGAGVVTTLVPPAVKCTNRFSELSHVLYSGYHAMNSPRAVSSNGFGYAMPQIDFPKFDGTNPKIWIKRCENFFDVCEIPMNHWVKFATMNFIGSAAFWMQSIEVNLKSFSWRDLCQAVVERFERDQHNHVVRQFFHIKQCGTVAEYVELFDELAHQLLAHDPLFNPVGITSKFVDGLKPDIKAVVLVQRPKDLDTASSLALLQEEVLMGQPSKQWKKNDEFAFGKQDFKVGSSYTPSRPMSGGIIEKKSTGNGKFKAQDEKLAALMAYRKAKGLCFKCGLKWGSAHQCPDSVPLSVVEEIWQMLSLDDHNNTHSEESDSGDDLVAVSDQAIKGTSGGKTIKLQASIPQFPALILVDSGSSHSFISEQFATNLPDWSVLANPIKVKVADGGILLCTHEVKFCDWLIQGTQFKTTFKILPLKCYDAILGMDWLERFSPMEVQWVEKWISFLYQGKKIKLQGLKDRIENGPPISGDQLYAMQKQEDIWCVVQVYAIESPEQQVEKGETMSPQMQALLESNNDLFAEPSCLPPSRSFDHTIPLLKGAQPFRIRPYRYTPSQKDEIETQVAHLLRNHMIQESSSPFASPVLLVKKKSGEWRLCVDFRSLNAYTIKNKFPLPIMEELFEELLGAKWFTTLDLRSGFHQILVAPEDQYKTAFQIHLGHYEYKVMPYGLTGAPATFQAVMNHILKPLLMKCVVVFIDDILIYNKSWEEHLQHVQLVFDILRQHQSKVRLSKCSFAKQQLKYLGHILSSEGVATDPSKIAIVHKWLIPNSVKELRSFLGMAGYYRRFVRNFGMLAKPLTDLLKKCQMFVWTIAHDESFTALKNALISAPVLALPDFNKTFVVQTDASNKGIGAVLHQDGHPIAFVSKALGPKNQGLSTYEKESLTILMAVDHWRSYLQPAEFIIQTDQRSLVYLDDQRLHNYWQQKATMKLMGLQYKICYKQRSTNRVADALSRMPIMNDSQVMAISVAEPVWLQDLQDSYQQSEEARKLLIELATDHKKEHFSLVQGVIQFKNRVWLGHSAQLQAQVMQALHSSPIGGHSGATVTLQRIKKLFYWPLMAGNIQKFVADCVICQQAKTERVSYPGLLQPLAVPSQAWHTVTLDFIEGLPKSAQFDYILVVVDKFSKYAHFIRLSHPFSALKVARLFMDHIYKLHGMPVAMVSDRDKVFTSHLWQELFKLSGT